MSENPSQPKQRRKYDPIFKKDAVQRVLRTGKSCSEVAQELGIRPDLVSRWQREYFAKEDQKVSSTDEMKPSDIARELREARQEIEDLQEQRDILKKALRIFSQVPPNGGKS